MDQMKNDVLKKLQAVAKDYLDGIFEAEEALNIMLLTLDILPEENS